MNLEIGWRTGIDSVGTGAFIEICSNLMSLIVKKAY